MKIICLQENLKSSLNIAQNIVGKNLTLPILNNLLLETGAGRLKISSTNLEIGINIWASGKIEKPGSITCPAKILTSFINALPNKKVELETRENDLLIKCEGYKASVKGLPVDDFPLIPKLKERPVVILKNGSMLKNGLAQVVGAAALSEARPEFSGILLKIEKNQIKLAATDSFRLAEKTIFEDTNASQPVLVILPQRTVQELIRILDEEAGGDIKIVLGDSQILFETSQAQLISRLIDGQYPDYQQIIPKNFTTRITLQRDEFINNIRIASIFSGKINDVKITAKPGKIEVSSQDPDTGRNSSEISAKVDGEPLEVSFNSRYLIDGLTNISTKQIFLGMNSENTNQSSRSNPAVLKPLGEESYVYVVMPIKTA